jgi:hypothetical protein
MWRRGRTARFGPAPDRATKALSAVLEVNTQKNATPKAQEEIYVVSTRNGKDRALGSCGDSHRTILFATRRETIRKLSCIPQLSLRAANDWPPSETPEFVFEGRTGGRIRSPRLGVAQLTADHEWMVVVGLGLHRMR